MTNKMTCKALTDEIEQLQTKYKAMSKLSWIIFKLSSWSLESALRDLDSENAESVKTLFVAFENTWLSWLSRFFDIYERIKGSLLHRLMTHIGENDENVVLNHPKADVLLSCVEKKTNKETSTLEIISKRLLIQQVMFFLDKEGFLYLINLCPKIDLSELLSLKPDDMKMINKLSDMVDPSALCQILESPDKKALFLYVLTLEKSAALISDVVSLISKTANSRQLNRIIKQLHDKACLYQGKVIESLKAFETLSPLDAIVTMTTRDWVTQDVVQRICTDRPFLAWAVYIAEQYSDIQLTGRISSVTDPRQLQDLCVALKHKKALLPSDIPLIIFDEQLRTLLSQLVEKDHPLSIGLIERLSSHHSKTFVYTLMENYPDVDVNQVMQLDYMDLQTLLDLNHQEWDSTQITLLLQADRFALFKWMKRLLETSLNLSMLRSLIQLSPDRAQSMYAMFNSLSDRGLIQAHNLEIIFHQLIQQTDFKMLKL